ncbi:pyridine nucleotide-disulfide oxidoreductase [Streptomyces sulfonofaciens]|uniref:Pyridine nucleotide-disulfide oxidoreductase n=1 Tax=Streptomyces sulfonofaciens TaxID=68272 RepID=A0A919GHD7_9ACTN|nr:FAD-dependent oxidoreductase [Streptomyces sulfonofaciens]GHH84574.1 pyridine nucleotide-disulfide oxidoreductase [Streptomyces sulfonofaciens]
MDTSKRRVVVIGGGYAGVKVARELDEFAEVTLVDGKEVFFHRIASLRASVDDTWTTAPFIPYSSLLRHGRTVLNKAVGIRTAERLVVLQSGHRLAYDVLVLASGADYQEPARFTGTTVEEAAESFHAHQYRAARARNVLIVGGGPSGVELAAELRRVRPDAQVTLAHSGSYLLSRTLSRGLGRRARSWLEAHDVRVHLRTVISSTGGGSSSLRDQNGTPFDAEVVFWTTGTTPNTLWLRLAGRGDWLDPSGHVKVDDHLRVIGRQDVFAVGDVNDVSEAKLSPTAMAQGSAAAHNIRAYLDRNGRHGSQPRPYRPAPLRAFSVPFGPDAGATLLPILGRGTAILGNRATARLKSRTLALPYANDLLNRPRT